MAKESKRTSLNENETGRKPYFNLDAEKAFFEEVDEEVRNEKFKELANKYGGWILTVLIIALTVAVSYEKIGEWRVSKAEQQNLQYVQAVSVNDSDYKNQINELENIINTTNNGIYKDIAKLQIANVLLENNQIKEALNALEEIYKDDSIGTETREIAAVKLATYKVDSAPYAEIETLLSPIIKKNGAWALIAKEFLAMSAIQNKDTAKAKSIYEELLNNGNISEDFKARINDMLASINKAENQPRQ